MKTYPFVVQGFLAFVLSHSSMKTFPLGINTLALFTHIPHFHGMCLPLIYSLHLCLICHDCEREMNAKNAYRQGGGCG